MAKHNVVNMKQKIKVKMLNKNIPYPKVDKRGEWIDLRAADDVHMRGPYTIQARKNGDRKTMFTSYIIPLGVAMELPKGYEALVNPRSSIYKSYTVMLANGQGIIDNSYKGNNDQWFAHVVSFKDNTIKEGDRICQFRIQLSQKATVWQKLKWLFTSGVEIEIVDKLNNSDRGGHGSTGKV